MTMPQDRPPNIGELTLPDGTQVSVMAWGKLKQDAVNRFGVTTLRTIWMPVLDMQNLQGDWLSIIWGNILATYEGENQPELLSGGEKSQAKLEPAKIQQMATLSALESRALETNTLSLSDIESNDAIRTLIGDMVKQWGTGLTVDPIKKLALVKQYLPEIPQSDEDISQYTTPEARRVAAERLRPYENLRTRQIEMARAIASAPEDKVDLVAQSYLRTMAQDAYPISNDLAQQFAKRGGLQSFTPQPTIPTRLPTAGAREPTLPKGPEALFTNEAAKLTEEDISRAAAAKNFELPEVLKPKVRPMEEIMPAAFTGNLGQMGPGVAAGVGEYKLQLTRERQQYEDELQKRWKSLVSRVRESMAPPERVTRY